MSIAIPTLCLTDLESRFLLRFRWALCNFQLATSTAFRQVAPKPPKDYVGSCWVCFVSGEIVHPKLINDWDAGVSSWVCGLMLGEERILWCFSQRAVKGGRKLRGVENIP